ncbi:MAG: carboxypeptidase regulatory-like domain-containing protein [Acidobacteriota bacterium]|nr:carboxypeptidase regulatory-like domain-containing protein [Acidobacteriota bacterium]
MSSLKRSAVVFAALCVLIAPTLPAQVTTGNIGGTVTTKQDNSALPGVTVDAIHVPTGTRYSTVAGANGYYLIPNVRIGGPYRVTAALEGFKPTTADHVQVNIGETANVPLVLALASVSEAIVVTASVDPIINPNHTGSTSSVSTEQIQALPTVNRQLQDYARTNPYVVTNLTTDGAAMTIAGRNNRYNSIQLDGAVNNDLFGLAASGTPGGQAGTQPFSLDAIQQLQIVISPYDVRQGGFTGGGINAVTRSGSNNLEGSVFGTRRNPSYVGKGPTNTKVGTFKQTQYGGRLGGPIMRDRIFYFLSGESNDRKEPNGTSADGSTGIVYTPGTGAPDAAAVAAFMKSKYNYDPGSLGDLIFGTKSKMFLGKLDGNLTSSHNLTLRHNYVSANQDNEPSSFTRSTTRFYFPTNIYQFPSKTNSTVAQLNSVLTANAFNEGRINVTKIREHRATPVIFPTVEIGPGGERAGAMQLGTERFSGGNALNQDINEITDDFTYTHGNHTMVFGTHNELFKFSNLFIQDFYGYYHFANFAALQAGTPDIYRVGFATGADPRRPTRFKAAQYSLYANDQWRFNPAVTLTFGLRADKPKFSTKPSFNPAVQTAIGFSTSAIPAEKVTWEPRAGFNWDIGSAGRQQLRGGIGVFQGRTPFVWISNNYGNTGIEQVLKGCTTASCLPTFNPDPASQPRLDNVAGAVQDVAVSDPDFRFPRILRSTLGYDRELFWGVRATAEVLWSKTLEDVYYQNVNKKLTGTSPLDGRPTYASIASTIGNAYFLTNTTKGNEITETLQFNKLYKNFTFNGSYAHQKAKSVGEGNSSTASSQWQFGFITRGDIYNPELSTSTFQVKHRISLATTYSLNTGPLSHNFGLFYVAQAGRPYSLLLGGDPNRDGSGNNDLLFIPSDLILCPATSNAAPTAAGPCRTSGGATQTALDTNLFSTFLSSVGLKAGAGTAPLRNSLQQPWTRRLDFHYEIGLPPMWRTRILVQADVLNLMNMFDKNSGVEKFVTNNTYMPVTYSGQDPTTGKPVYRETAPGRLTPGNQFSTANLGSRWQGRLGLRVNF